MRLLLDTHALIWWLTDHPRLSRAARSAIAEPDNAPFASAASGYEIANKQRLGKLSGRITAERASPSVHPCSAPPSSIPLRLACCPVPIGTRGTA